MSSPTDCSKKLAPDLAVIAANHGATRERDALYHYNPSQLYVDAVARYANRIARDSHAFFRYYSWQVYFRTRTGYRRVTGPR